MNIAEVSPRGSSVVLRRAEDRAGKGVGSLLGGYDGY